MVNARHTTCGRTTRVRLPWELPAHAVRRVVCDRCRERFETESVEEVAIEPLDTPSPFETPRRLRLPTLSLPALSRPSLPTLSRPSLEMPKLDWRHARLPLAAGAVVLALLAIRNASEPAPDASSATSDPATTAERSQHGAGVARVVHGDRFTLALPVGWKRTLAPNGAAFAAAARGGHADATLWIQRMPGLDFAAFEQRSLAQLGALAGNAHVVEMVPAPTVEQTVVKLAADSPAGRPQYQVTLRASGPYRYYLATTVEPGTAGKTAAGASLIQNSFIPSEQ